MGHNSESTLNEQTTERVHLKLISFIHFTTGSSFHGSNSVDHEFNSHYHLCSDDLYSVVLDGMILGLSNLFILYTKFTYRTIIVEE